MLDKNLLFPTKGIVSVREAIHLKAMELAADCRLCESKLFEIIVKVEEQKIYYDMELPNLFSYCVEMLRLSRHTAHDFCTVVRKAQEVPALAEAMLNAKTSLSKLRRICSVINEKNQKEWIGLAIECTSCEIEKCVAMANPRAAILERMTYVAEDTLQFQLAVSEEWSELLSSVKDLFSQKYMRPVSSEEVLFLLMQTYKIKNDPVLKARARKSKRRKRRRVRRMRSSGRRFCRILKIASLVQNQARMKIGTCRTMPYARLLSIVKHLDMFQLRNGTQ